MNLNRLDTYHINFQSNSVTSDKKRNVAIGCVTGALITPILPLIDGDSLKTAYKNRNILKMSTGFAAIGGGLVGAKLLTDRFVDSKRKATIQYSLLGGFSVPLTMLIDKWSQKNKKRIASKWYLIAAISGMLIGTVSKNIDIKESLFTTKN